MGKPIVKLLVLVSAMAVGLIAYYVFISSASLFSRNSSQPVSGLENPDIATFPSSEVSNREPTSADYYPISPCTDKNLFLSFPRLKPKGTVKGGVVNNRIMCGNLPEVPADSKGFWGTIFADVLIDGIGEVTKASCKDGNRLLAASIIKAAKSTRFTPTLLGGEVVRVQGELMYDFDPSFGVRLHKFSLPN